MTIERQKCRVWALGTIVLVATTLAGTQTSPGQTRRTGPLRRLVERFRPLRVQHVDEMSTKDKSHRPQASDLTVVHRIDEPDRVSEHNVVKTVGMKMNLLPAGKFKMGLAGATLPQDKQRGVTIEQAFYIGVYEVTQDEFRRVMGENPSFFRIANLPLWVQSARYR